MLFWIARDLSDTRGSRRRARRKAQRKVDGNLLTVNRPNQANPALSPWVHAGVAVLLVLFLLALVVL